MKKLLFVFGIAFLLFSCEKESVTDLTDDKTVNNSDLMLKSGSPDQPGDNMKVYRFEGYYVWVLTDIESGLTAVIGGDATSVCTTGDWLPDLLTFQDIVKEEVVIDDAPRVHRLLKGDDVSVNVWGAVPLTCFDVLNVEPVFSGAGDYVSTDNDLIAYDRDNDNTNVWGLRLNGDGIQIIYHAMWDGEDPSTFKESTRIKVK